MFAYCENNPICLCDAAGDKSIWSLLFAEHQFGYIHACVIAHIILSYGFDKYHSECWLYGMHGRADIVSTSGEVWEVKSDTQGSEIALTQAQEYLYNKTIRDDITIMNLGAACTFKGQFYIFASGWYYLVTYWTPEDGVVLYHVGQGTQTASENIFVYWYNTQTEKYNYTAPAFIPVPIPVLVPAGGWGGGGNWQNTLHPQMA